MRVFVTHRPGDGEATALTVSRYLSDLIGERNVFHAGRPLWPGAASDGEPPRDVGRGDVLVAVIGARWLGAPGTGGRALDDPGDRVRRELALALSRQVRVVPVLVDDARPPTGGDLPDVLAGLALRRFVRLDFRAPDAGLGRLADALDLPGVRRGGIGSTHGTAATDARGDR